MSRLERYLAKRDFGATPEPSETGASRHPALRYSMQKHAATRLHFDLRLEWDGALLSWAVTRGPSLDPSEKRLAVRTEDHPISYLDFEGTIPEGNYGAGTVMLWDIGHWQPLADPEKGLAKGHLRLRLHGRRLTGDWHLIRMKGRRNGDKGRENWLLTKVEDEAAGRADPVRRHRRSVGSGRTMRAIGAGKAPQSVQRGAAVPRFRKPQLATLSDTLPKGDDWWHELKFDGYRALVALGRSGTRVHTRSGQDWSDRFAPLLNAFDDVACDAALIDGEIVAGAGTGGFGALQQAIKAGGPFAFHAFDLLHLDGDDLAPLPLADRRERLERLFRPLPPLGPVALSPILGGDPAKALATICGAGGEGLIAKCRDAPYRGARTKGWLKVKCQRRDDFLVIGWTRSRSRGRPFASLLLASEQGGGLSYAGKVGTGFDGETMADLAETLRTLATGRPPLDVPRAEAEGATWVEPRLRVEVSYAETTQAGRLRHAVFEGVREDMAPTARTAGPDREGPMVADVRISSPDRLVFPKAGITKLQVAEYYAAIAERMLPACADRPLSLVRLPEGLPGERFFQKHAGKGFPDGLKPVEIEESDGDTATYMRVADAAGLVGAAQMGTVEFHIWGARRDRLDRPDRMVFDLDPDESVSFAEVRAAAAELRDRLDELGLAAWPMVTGGKGVHVVVPLRRTVTWDTMALFSRTAASLLAQREPGRFTAEMSKRKRRGRIFIDWLRNQRGATAISPFSLRAREGAPVAVPVSWPDLEQLDRADGFAMADVLEDGGRRLPDAGLSSLGAAAVEKLEEVMGARA